MVFKGRVKKQTEKGILFQIHQHNPYRIIGEYWFPKSKCEFISGKDSFDLLIIPNWLAVEKGITLVQAD